MIEKEKNTIYSKKIYLFFIIFFLLIIQSHSFKFLKSFNLLSNNILLITDEGIIKYEPSTNNQTLVQSSDLISSEKDLEYISFLQFPSYEGGDILCRLKNHIFIFDENLNNNNITFQISELLESPCVMNSYKTIDGKFERIISFFDNNNDLLRIIIYEININQEDQIQISPIYQDNRTLNDFIILSINIIIKF